MLDSRIPKVLSPSLFLSLYHYPGPTLGFLFV